MTIQQNYSLKKLNSFGIDVFAKSFASFTNSIEVTEILESSNDKKLILGGGSNILFTKNFDGLLLKNEITGIEIIKEDENNVYVKAGAGEGWHQFVLYDVAGNDAVASVGLSPRELQRPALLIVHSDVLRHLRNL